MYWGSILPINVYDSIFIIFINVYIYIYIYILVRYVYPMFADDFTIINQFLSPYNMCTSLSPCIPHYHPCSQYMGYVYHLIPSVPVSSHLRLSTKSAPRPKSRPRVPSASAASSWWPRPTRAACRKRWTIPPCKHCAWPSGCISCSSVL